MTINAADTSVTANDPELTSNDIGAGTAYQWIDCDNGNVEISGATSASYTATANGNYAVVVMANGCSDTSACYTVSSVGILENSFDKEILLYPNPTDGNFSVDLGEIYKTITVTMMDLNGKIIKLINYNDNQLLNLIIDEPTGVYLLIIESGDKKAVIRLVKQ